MAQPVTGLFLFVNTDDTSLWDALGLSQMIECYMKGLEWSVGARAHGEVRINSGGPVLPGCEGFRPQPGSRLTDPGVFVGKSVPSSLSKTVWVAAGQTSSWKVFAFPLSKSLSSCR